MVGSSNDVTQQVNMFDHAPIRTWRVSLSCRFFPNCCRIEHDRTFSGRTCTNHCRTAFYNLSLNSLAYMCQSIIWAAIWYFFGELFAAAEIDDLYSISHHFSNLFSLGRMIVYPDGQSPKPPIICSPTDLMSHRCPHNCKQWDRWSLLIEISNIIHFRSSGWYLHI